MTKNLVKSIFAFLLFTFYFLLFITPSYASIEIDPLRIELEASEGKTYSGYITITNHGSENVEVSLSPGDYRYMLSENTIYPSSNKSEFLPSCKNWINFTPDRINLDKNATQQIAYTVKVPADAMANEYVSSILVDEEQEPSLIEQGKSGQVRIKITPRISIPVYIAIEKYLEYSCVISDFTATVSDKEKSVELVVKLENNGTAHIRPVTKLVILDEYGTVINKISLGKSLPIFADFGEKLTTTWKPKFKGKYTAVATVDIGTENLIQKSVVFEVK